MQCRYDSEEERHAAHKVYLHERRSTKLHVHSQQERLQHYRSVAASGILRQLCTMLGLPFDLSVRLAGTSRTYVRLRSHA